MVKSQGSRVKIYYGSAFFCLVVENSSLVNGVVAVGLFVACGNWSFNVSGENFSASVFYTGVRGENQKVRDLHFLIGCCMISLVMLLLAIGIVGTFGHFGSLGHSSHLLAGLIVVALVLISAFSATQISARKSWARPLHIGTNIILFVGFAWVSLTGWIVVQKYLPISGLTF